MSFHTVSVVALCFVVVVALCFVAWLYAAAIMASADEDPDFDPDWHPIKVNGEKTGILSGNSHQRRIARRKLRRANKVPA